MYYCFRCRREFCEPQTIFDNPSGLWGGEESWRACPWCKSEYFEEIGKIQGLRLDDIQPSADEMQGLRHDDIQPSADEMQFLAELMIYTASPS